MSALDIVLRHDKDCSYHYLGELAQANCDCGVTEALKELAALRNPWQPISTAPKDGTHISVYSDIDGDGLLIEFWDVENGEWFYGSVYETDVEWTHWKPFETPEGES